MIFSVWNPDGGYDYYETNQRHGIGDDLPNVHMPQEINDIGVPSQDVGRRLPGDARKIGHGTEPKGVMAPMDRGQVKGLKGVALSGGEMGGAINILVMGALVWAGYVWGKRS